MAWYATCPGLSSQVYHPVVSYIILSRSSTMRWKSQVQRTLAKSCFGIFFSGKKRERNNALKANEFPTPTVHYVEFRDHFHHCHLWTMNLEARSWDTDTKFQVVDQCTRHSDGANFSVTAVLCSVTLGFLQTLRSTE